MSLPALQELWDQMQGEKLEAVKAWTPPSDIANNISDFRALMDTVNRELQAAFDTESIHALEHEIAKLEGALSSEDFRTWNLGRAARARTAGEAQSVHARDKIMQIMGLA